MPVLQIPVTTPHMGLIIDIEDLSYSLDLSPGAVVVGYAKNLAKGT